MNYSTPRSSGQSGLRRTGRWLRRVLLLAVVLSLVAGLGTTVTGPTADAEPVSHSERAQLAAEGTARELADAAAVLAAETPGPLSAQFSRTADVLRQHALALDHPLYSPGAAAPAASVPSASVPAASVPPADPAGPARFLSRLAGSVRVNLESAHRADPGIARILASTAAGQWVQVLALAELQELPTPQLLVPAADGAPADLQDPENHCSGTAEVPTAQLDALTAAVQAEHMAAYAYEVAAALAEDPEELLAGAVSHGDAAGEGEGLLRALCADVPAAVAAYRLEESFHRDPEDALLDLEQEMVRLYADVAGLTQVPVRDWAAERLRIGAQRIFDAGGPLAAFPGLNKPQQAQEPPGRHESP